MRENMKLKLWPSESFEIETTKSRAEMVETLSVHVEPKKIYRFFSEHTTFEGAVTQDGFKIRPIMRIRNPCLPIITGKFRTGKSGITVAINMRLNAFVSVFLCVWFGFAGVGIMDCLAEMLTRQDTHYLSLLVSLCTFILGCYAFIMFLFWSEAKKAKRLLSELFR